MIRVRLKCCYNFKCGGCRIPAASRNQSFRFVASPASDAKEDNIGHAKDEGGQPCNSQLLEALGVPKAHRHVVERFFDVLLGNASFIANERVERLSHRLGHSC